VGRAEEDPPGRGRNLSPSASRRLVRIRVIMALGFMVLGIFVGIRNSSDYIVGTRTTGWTETTGIIESSSVRVYQGHGGSRTNPAIGYRWEVDGVMYRGNRVAYANVWTAVNNDAREFILDYPEGSTVPVHYDPSDPARAVLVPGSHVRALIWSALGIPIFLLGVYVWAYRGEE